MSMAHNINNYVDYYRMYGRFSLKWQHRVFPCLIPPQIRHFILIRKWQNTHSNLNKFLLKTRIHFLQKRSFIDIPPQTKLGNGLLMYHTGGVIVNDKAIIGNNVTLSPGVTIGKTANKKGDGPGYPKIGNEVWIGTNAVIIGNVTIGDNVLIAANCFVNRNVPSNSVVFGNPAIIKEGKQNATTGYIRNRV